MLVVLTKRRRTQLVYRADEHSQTGVPEVGEEAGNLGIGGASSFFQERCGGLTDDVEARGRGDRRGCAYHRCLPIQRAKSKIRCGFD